MSATVIKPPNVLPLHRCNGIVPGSVFLAGSIEMGLAEDWQKKATEAFEPHAKYIFNPRRDDWNKNWKQSIDHPEFNTQVNWELHALDIAQYIFMYFDINTKSPISLLELGLYATSKRLVVCCPEGFWRKGNVEVVCARYGIYLHTHIESAMREVALALDFQNRIESGQSPTDLL